MNNLWSSIFNSDNMGLFQNTILAIPIVYGFYQIKLFKDELQILNNNLNKFKIHMDKYDAYVDKYYQLGCNIDKKIEDITTNNNLDDYPFICKLNSIIDKTNQIVNLTN